MATGLIGWGGVAAGVAAALVVSLAAPPAKAAGPQAAATVQSAQGNVSVLRDGVVWALFSNQTVQVGETIVTGEDGYAELLVSDGSSFAIYPNSQVVFRSNPGNLRDLLDVFLGRVRVYIQKLGGRPNRYRIFTPTAVISVRGTSFDVSVDEDETTLIAVEEGLVGVTHRLLPSENEIAVEAGQSLVVYPSVPLAKAGVDKVKVVRVVEGIARTAASIWSRTGRGAGGSGGTGGGGAPIPGDTPAPPPPPPPGPE